MMFIEFGFSTMPHKINPIDYENAESNLESWFIEVNHAPSLRR